MQGPFAIAVCEPDGGAGFTQVAREHFGALTPLHAYGSPAQAMAEVSRGAATVAVLPIPSETETARDAWWTALLQNDEPRMHVVAGCRSGRRGRRARPGCRRWWCATPARCDGARPLADRSGTRSGCQPRPADRRADRGRLTPER